MNTNPQKKLQEGKSVEAFATYSRTRFLIGWTKRFGLSLILFVFPPGNK